MEKKKHGRRGFLEGEKEARRGGSKGEEGKEIEEEARMKRMKRVKRF